MQKKWFIFVVLLFLAIPAQAQWFVGGRASLNANFRDKSGGFSLRPDVGYSFKNISVGVNAIVEYYGYTPSESEKRESNITFGLAPYIQYYFVRLERVSFYLDCGVDVTRYTAPETSFWRFIPYLSPGIDISLTDHWSFLGTLGRLDYDTDNHTLGFSVDGTAFTAGVYYTF